MRKASGRCRSCQKVSFWDPNAETGAAWDSVYRALCCDCAKDRNNQTVENGSKLNRLPLLLSLVGVKA